ncbi:hypothetical protein BDV29DRAFT_172480 [Aspergillus leporis]|jgi:ankyrin repeat protein|uniref:Uncharacterized protein n=1 Tax=Aspergillus leporis TaxID=41062 RepID=A0A5N5X3A1_9EURO|nr:hypothetical protein BDV29DRAFT_172480 [Aspergillus leporis]
MGAGAMVDILVQHPKVDVNCRCMSDGATPLTIAAEKGHVAILLTLLKSERVTIDVHDTRGLPVLSVAASHGQVEAIEALLRHPKVDAYL